ncbi:MAG: OmpA family protein [Emcibacteraceae bacterium]|nr:OmpA family protein [Emcibacteraceae bacterium]
MLNKVNAKFLIMIGAALVLSACANKDEQVMDTAPAEPAARPAPAAPAPVAAPVDMTTQEWLENDVMSGGMDASMVHFGFDRYDVDASARGILQAQATWMKTHNKSIVVEGHCDERGTREYNLALGDRRANAVKNYLVAMGVSANRIRTVSYGKERPMGTDAGMNRRGKTRVN